MSAKMRIGVAGASLIGRKHVELIAASADCVLAGIADPSPAAKALAEANDAPWYADHRALLQHERPDGLIIASPNAWSYPGQVGWHAPLRRDHVAAASFDPLVEQLRHFLAVIAKREAPLVSADDAMRTLAVVEAVSEAARRGSRVSPGDIMEQAA